MRTAGSGTKPSESVWHGCQVLQSSGTWGSAWPPELSTDQQLPCSGTCLRFEVQISATDQSPHAGHSSLVLNQQKAGVQGWREGSLGTWGSSAGDRGIDSLSFWTGNTVLMNFSHLPFPLLILLASQQLQNESVWLYERHFLLLLFFF